MVEIVPFIFYFLELESKPRAHKKHTLDKQVIWHGLAIYSFGMMIIFSSETWFTPCSRYCEEAAGHTHCISAPEDVECSSNWPWTNHIERPTCM